MQAIGALLGPLAVMAALLFVSAGTLDYRQAWLFLAAFGLSSLVATVYLMIKDPRLLARRMHAGPGAETQTVQKIVMSAASAGFIALLVVSAIDHRFGWSHMFQRMAIGGDVLVLLGFTLVFLVIVENPFASATIELAADQRVVSTGLYALVRHPMYTAGLIYLIGIPIALGSWWGLIPIVLLVPALIWRLLDEEKFLAKNLPGSTEYTKTVKYRLLPLMW